MVKKRAAKKPLKETVKSLDILYTWLSEQKDLEPDIREGADDLSRVISWLEEAEGRITDLTNTIEEAADTAKSAADDAESLLDDL